MALQFSTEDGNDTENRTQVVFTRATGSLESQALYCRVKQNVKRAKLNSDIIIIINSNLPVLKGM